MCEHMCAVFHTDVLTLHLVGDGGGGSRAKVGVKNQIARLSRDAKNAFDERLRLWCVENGFFGEQFYQVFLRLVICANIFGEPKCFRSQAL